MATDVTDVVEGIVHEPTQTEGPGLDLTLAEVYEVARPGRVDFGGSEFERADHTAIPTTLRHSEDDYGWYTLDAGQYLVAFNERLVAPAGERYWLQTRDAVRENGAFHPSLRVEELAPQPLAVGGAGIRLKENARISTLYSL